MTPSPPRNSPIDFTIEEEAAAMTKMIDRLTALHRAIDSAVARERARLAPDPLHIAALKKRRLAIKDHLHRALTRRVTATA